MPAPIQGIHHITAIASEPQQNLDFYTQVLGLRFVKKTVNFDDPGTYHFFFGDEQGHPGTILTFFPWPGARRGRKGVGQVAVIGYAIPAGSLGFWQERLKSKGVTTGTPFTRYGDEVMTVLDHDGLQLELVESPGADLIEGWAQGGVPAEHAIRGFHSPTLMVEGYEQTARLLSDTFGFTLSEHSDAACRFRYAAKVEPGAFRPGFALDVECRPSERPGQMGAGVVHHIALRVPDDAAQLEWRELLVNQGFNVTPVMDRQYFHSIYFREPGGILFELATDPPGFFTDETVDTLGSGLRLPPWLEARRDVIEQVLPPVQVEA